MYQEIHPCKASSIGSVKINTSLPMMRECMAFPWLNPCQHTVWWELWQWPLLESHSSLCSPPWPRPMGVRWAFFGHSIWWLVMFAFGIVTRDCDGLSQIWIHDLTRCRWFNLGWGSRCCAVRRSACKSHIGTCLLQKGRSLPARSGVRYAKFLSIQYLIYIDFLQNSLINIDINILNSLLILIFLRMAISIYQYIDISIFFKLSLSIFLSISIFSKCSN